MTATGKTGIIPFRLYGGYRKSPGSSFIRADGLVASTNDFEIWKHGHKYDNLIFQKAYWPEMMRLFSGPKILDLSDPDWIIGSVDINEIGSLTDAITCSSEKLTKMVSSIFPNKPVVHVPDRLNLSEFPTPRGVHTGFAKNIVWFGYIHNAVETLSSLVSTLLKYNCNLIIIANRDLEYKEILSGLKYSFIKYETQTAYEWIKKADMVINPKSNRGLFKFKSNNKSVISWKLGVPVAETKDEFEKLLDPDQRNKEVAQNTPIIKRDYDIVQSAQQYREIIETIQKIKY